MRVRWVFVLLAIVYWHEDIHEMMQPLIRISKTLPATATTYRKALNRKLRHAVTKVPTWKTPYLTEIDNTVTGRPVPVVPLTTDTTVKTAQQVIHTDSDGTEKNFLPGMQKVKRLPGTRHAIFHEQESLLSGSREKEMLGDSNKEIPPPGVSTKTNIFVEMGAGKQKHFERDKINETLKRGKSQSRQVFKMPGEQNIPLPKGEEHAAANNVSARNANAKILHLLKERKEGACESVDPENELNSDEQKLSATIIGLRPIYTREARERADPPGMQGEKISVGEECDLTVCWGYGLELLCGILYSTIISTMIYLRKHHSQFVKEYASTIDTTRSFVTKMQKQIKLHGIRQNRLKQSWGERQSRIKKESENLKGLLSNFQHGVTEDGGSGEMKHILDSFALTSEHLSMNALEGLDCIGLLDKRINEQEPLINQLKDELLLWESIVAERKVTRGSAGNEINSSP